MPAANWTNQQVLNQLVSGYQWTGSVITYAFPTSTAGMTASSETAGFTALSTTQKNMATLALSLWDDVMAADFALTTSSASNIEFGNSTTGVSYAHTYFPTAGTVWFNPAYSDLTNPQIGKHGFLAYIHELGHALGLDHMGDYNGSGNWTPSSYQDSTVLSIMSYFGPSWGSGAANGEGLVAWADWVGSDGQLYSPQTPMLNDIMAIQSVYGAETTTRVGDTVYGFNSTVGSLSGGIYDFTINTNPVLCIYDSSGIDTLDLSGWSTSCVINLAPGSLSSANSMTYNISIAYTCDIENGIGGSGADSLSGNALANFLSGLGGNDTLNGGAGNDTLNGGGGTDTAVYGGAFSSYSISYNSATGAFTITGDGTDTVTDVELFQFSDVTKTAAELAGGGPALPAVSVAAVTTSAAEGNAGTTIYTFQVTLSAAAASAQTVSYTVAGTGAAPASSPDFTGALSGIVSFAAGETSKTIQVLVAGDTVVEQNETFAVTLSGASSGLVVGTSQATATILNDDASAPPPPPPPAPVTVNVITGNSNANFLSGTSGVDKISGLGGNDLLYGWDGNDILIGGSGGDTLDGGAGSDWASYEGSSAVNVSLANGMAFGGDAFGDKFVSIENLKGSSYADTLTGSAAANILDGGAGNDTLNGGGGTDTAVYGGAFSSYSISYNSATGAFTITGDGTDTVTDVELFQFSDVTKTAAELAGGGPALPAVSVAAVTTSAAEGNAGTTIYTFQVTLSAAAASAQTVSYTVAGTGAAPASSPDFTGALSGIVSFAAGETSKTIQVLVAGDTVVEQNETFAVTLSGASSGLVVGTSQATATILNDDASAPPPPPPPAPVTVNVITGNSNANFLSGTSGVDKISGLGGNDLLYGWDGNDILIGGSGGDTLDGGAGSDWASYEGSSAVNVSLANGMAFGGDAFGDKFVSIENLKGSSYADTLTGSAAANILDGGAGNDTLNGGGGTDTAVYGGAFSSYSISYNSATGAFTITGDGTDTVTDVELFQFSDVTKTAAELAGGGPALPAVSVAAVTTSAAEGNAGTTIYTFQVTLSAAAASAQTVSYTVAGTGAAPASSPDFTGALSGIVSFAAGETSKTIQVLVAGDTVVEQNETFAVTLSGASSGLVVGTSQATATILNDDASAPPPPPPPAPVTVNVITGNSNANFLSGTSGVDKISGLGGNDLLYGWDGNDILIGGSGGDTLDGGAGSDWASYEGSSAVNVSLANGMAFGGDAFGDKFVSIENLKGSSYADTLTGSAAANILDGGAGNDTLNGGAGGDTFDFSDLSFGNDRITDYEDNLDKLSFSMNVADSFDDFVIAGNGTTSVTVTHGSDSVVLNGVAAITLAADDFIFV